MSSIYLFEKINKIYKLLSKTDKAKKKKIKTQIVQIRNKEDVSLETLQPLNRYE